MVIAISRVMEVEDEQEKVTNKNICEHKGAVTQCSFGVVNSAVSAARFLLLLIGAKRSRTVLAGSPATTRNRVKC